MYKKGFNFTINVVIVKGEMKRETSGQTRSCSKSAQPAGVAVSKAEHFSSEAALICLLPANNMEDEVDVDIEGDDFDSNFR